MDTQDNNQAPEQGGAAYDAGLLGNGHIAFEGLTNTRDLGCIETRGGRRIVQKRLLRSGMLYSATEHDEAVLRDEYRLAKVVDFRTAEERASRPDPIDALKPAEFIDIPLMSTETLGITREGGAESLAEIVKEIAQNPVAMMVGMYPRLLTDEASQKGLAQFFNVLLADEAGAVLWHCTAGKDRAGIAAFLLLVALDVPQEVAVQDYLATNKYMHASTQEIMSVLAMYGLNEKLKDSLMVLNSADVRFLQAALDAVDKEYGGLDPYLREAIGLTDDKKQALRAKYTAA